MIFIKIALLVLFCVFLRGVLLSMVAKTLGMLLEPLNLISAIIINIRRRGIFRVINQYQLKSAREAAIYFQYNFRALWRLTMSNGKGYRFGRDKEMTLSVAIGKKRSEKTLSIHGLFWYYVLFLIDCTKWFKGGHCKFAYFSYSASKNK